MFAGRKFAALLFDMDGTVVNSIAAAIELTTVP
ncbi:MAG: HAD family hydrolase, partial [Mesorhizobium sp.]